MNESLEKNRQIKESFEVHKKYVKGMNTLKVVMGYTSIFLLTVILVSCLVIFWKSKELDHIVVVSATGAFFIDFVALIFLIYKMIFNYKYKELRPFE